ncbi:MAG: hypothetical protein FJ317_06590 [SAR202 cluster bacterium]|nr:hypothetical protein [SAR202 cluster bacterium]
MVQAERGNTSPMRINAEWHKANEMTKNATLEQRIAWHTEHARECGCRPIPPRLLEEMRKRERQK